MGIDIVALFVAVPVAILAAVFVFFVRSSAVKKAPPPEVQRTKPIWKRPRLVGYWASAISLSIVYLVAGLPKLGGLDELLHQFSNWGYSEDFLTFIGASEFIAAIFLLIPQTAMYAALYLAAIMVGAIYTHLAFDTVWWALLPTFCLSFLMFIAYEARARHKREAASGAGVEPARGAQQAV